MLLCQYCEHCDQQLTGQGSCGGLATHTGASTNGLFAFNTTANDYSAQSSSYYNHNNQQQQRKQQQQRYSRQQQHSSSNSNSRAWSKQQQQYDAGLSTISSSAEDAGSSGKGHGKAAYSARKLRGGASALSDSRYILTAAPVSKRCCMRCCALLYCAYINGSKARIDMQAARACASLLSRCLPCRTLNSSAVAALYDVAQ
jgi:hypothetical protein